MQIKVKDLLEVLWTDSIVIAKGTDIFAEIEMTHTGQALDEYMDAEIANIVPLNHAMEINLKQ